ncbi:unnamed protein product [Meganyctiphanes norvegica]|uniref:Uncharacterized protein n=1 Tax=Meganyctiphanes norvegica TaxID=48144 RepID=A0AAV2QV59_MEGNR
MEGMEVVVVPLEEDPLEEVPLEVVPLEVVPLEVAPLEVVPLEVAPLEVVPLEVVPLEVVPTEVALVVEAHELSRLSWLDTEQMYPHPLVVTQADPALSKLNWWEIV